MAYCEDDLSLHASSLRDEILMTQSPIMVEPAPKGHFVIDSILGHAIPNQSDRAIESAADLPHGA
jgi:hypothetical protein